MIARSVFFFSLVPWVLSPGSCFQCMFGKFSRHGLGFNSIFNITDLPTILSAQLLGDVRQVLEGHCEQCTLLQSVNVPHIKGLGSPTCRIRYILLLDPHVSHLETLGATTLKPGAKLDLCKKAGALAKGCSLGNESLSQDFKRCWPDQFASYELEGCQLSTGQYQGTLIRAPLRQKPSEISHQIFGEEHLQKLRELIEDEGQHG